MFERDYIVEIVGEFARRVGLALRRALDGDRAGVAETEREVADLLELDPQVALALAPDSLVTMMVLSGMGDAVASYVCYTLERVARLYDRAGDEDLAGLRHLQAKAVAESFGCDADAVPEGMEGLGI
ncbi:hypothetical protein [Thermophilibacter sp.]